MLKLFLGKPTIVEVYELRGEAWCLVKRYTFASAEGALFWVRDNYLYGVRHVVST